MTAALVLLGVLTMQNPATPHDSGVVVTTDGLAFRIKVPENWMIQFEHPPSASRLARILPSKSARGLMEVGRSDKSHTQDALVASLGGGARAKKGPVWQAQTASTVPTFVVPGKSKVDPPIRIALVDTPRMTVWFKASGGAGEKEFESLVRSFAIIADPRFKGPPNNVPPHP